MSAQNEEGISLAPRTSQAWPSSSGELHDVAFKAQSIHHQLWEFQCCWSVTQGNVGISACSDDIYLTDLDLDSLQCCRKFFRQNLGTWKPLFILLKVYKITTLVFFAALLWLWSCRERHCARRWACTYHGINGTDSFRVKWTGSMFPDGSWIYKRLLYSGSKDSWKTCAFGMHICISSA